jgi:hypothetical protein
MEADAAAAAADVEDAAADEPHRLPVVRGPATERREVDPRPRPAGADEAVLALDDLHRRPPFEQRQQELPVRVADVHPRYAPRS